MPLLNRRLDSWLVPFLALTCLLPFGPGTLALADPVQDPPTKVSPAQDARTYFDTHAVPLSDTGSFPDAAYDQLKRYRLTLVGEMHGTAEAPRLVLELVRLMRRHGHKVFLGLELPTNCQSGVDRYRLSGDRRDLETLAFFQRPLPNQDGRSSKAMAELIRATRDMPDVQLVCLDAPARDGKTRDAAMAEALDQQLHDHSDWKGVVLTGNLHTKMSPVSLSQGLYHPMGDELCHRPGASIQRSEILAVNIQSEELSAWEATNEVTGVITYPKDSSWYATVTPWNGYLLVGRREYEGYDAVLFWRKLTPSEPFVDVATLPQHSSATAIPEISPAGSHPELSAELQQMYQADQAIRTQIRTSALADSAELWKQCSLVDSKNTARMKAIVKQYGWPTQQLVGATGAHDAWLLVQHADRDVAFQDACLPMLLEAAQRGEGSLSDVAYLTDRVRVNQGKKQVYGTQFTVQDGRRVPFPLEDPDQVDLRRAKMGLNTLAEYTKELYDFYGQPADQKAKSQDHP